MACLGHRHGLCADGGSYADGHQTWADALIAQRPCADGLWGCADGLGPSAPRLAAVVITGGACVC
jgi:hypothetical protein